MAPKQLKEGAPSIDDGHQTHPVESAELIAKSLQEFTAALGADYVDPQPDESFHLMFLRTEVFHVDLAVKRYKKYWERRVELMGSDRTPLALHEEADQATLELGYARLVRGHPRVIAIDPSRTARNYNATSVARSIYYTMHQALERSEELQRKGAVYVIDCGTIRTFDRKLVMLVERMISDAFPARQTMCCLINLPKVAGFVVNLLRMILKPEMRKRLRVVNDANKFPHIMGISEEELTGLVGYQPWKEDN